MTFILLLAYLMKVNPETYLMKVNPETRGVH